MNNVLFDNNMLAGDDFSGKGSAINAVPYTINTTTYPVNYADGNSTAVRIKSDQAAGGLVTNVKYSNSCFLDHNKDLLFTPLYNTSAGSDTPDVYNILLQNLAFLNDAGGTGTVQFTGTDTVVNGQTLIYPLQITLDNVTFPSALTPSKFTVSSTSGKEQYSELTYGPGGMSANFIADWATFVAVPTNYDTVTNNSTASPNPPACNFTYIAPELTGPRGLPQTITYGQTATAVAILTPAVALAAYPTGTVTLTDALTGGTFQAALPGTGDTIFVPMTGLSVGTHVFTMAYSGDANYVPVPGQAAYSTAGPYVVTVLPAPPVANAGSNQTVNVGALVSLNGTASSDPNSPQIPLTFQFSQTSGPAVVLSAANTAAPTFTPVAAGIYTFSLLVSDGSLSSSSSVTISVNPQPLLPTSIWVTDGDGSGVVRVEQFNSSGNYLGQFQINGGGRFPNGVAGMAIAPNGTFYISDIGNKNVSVFSSAGACLGTFGSYGSGNGQFLNGIGGVAIDASGNVWVVDAGNDRVQEFNSSGAYLNQFGGVGNGNGQFHDPTAIVIDNSGNIWVTDGDGSGTVRVEEFSGTGVYLNQFPINGGGRFPNGAAAIAIGPNGNFYITDIGNKNVSEFSSSGTYLGSFGGWGTGNGQFTGNQGVAVDANGSVWAADIGGDRIEEFSLTGVYLAQFGSVGNGNGQFHRPGAVVIH